METIYVVMTGSASNPQAGVIRGIYSHLGRAYFAVNQYLAKEAALGEIFIINPIPDNLPHVLAYYVNDGDWAAKDLEKWYLNVSVYYVNQPIE